MCMCFFKTNILLTCLFLCLLHFLFVFSFFFWIQGFPVTKAFCVSM